MQDPAIGLIVIGQTPRPSLTEELLQGCSSNIRIVQIGTLDGLSSTEIAALSPKDDNDTLFTTLPDGTDIHVSKQEIFRLVGSCLNTLEASGVQVSLLCCSGAFPAFDSKVRLIEPVRILSGLAAAALPKGRLGLLIPLAEQTGHLTRKWQREGVEVVVEAAAPGSTEEAIEAAAKSLAEKSPDIIVMDCMSYTASERAIVRSIFKGPIITAMSASGRVLEELVA
ncbi:AroM family protein [Mesorhizobium sp. Z1-4]|uniref:AroM family protein n=1 Tax=Mesorhizobium sp. Z1-4 TaxID=2448478 RepID=UPI000FD7C752|nr:AroM family protein [Mesorhizobium sp. Z1-4]